MYKSCQSNTHDRALKTYSAMRDPVPRLCVSGSSLSGEQLLLFCFFCFLASFLLCFFPPQRLVLPDWEPSASDNAISQPEDSRFDLWLRGTGLPWGLFLGVCIRSMALERGGCSVTGWWWRMYPRIMLISICSSSPLCIGPAKNSSELISKYRTAYKVSSPRTSRLFFADNSSLLLLHSRLHHLTKASNRTPSKGKDNVSLSAMSLSPSRSKSSSCSCSKTSLVWMSIYCRQLCWSAPQYDNASVMSSLLAGRHW